MREFHITDDGIRLHAKLDIPEGGGRRPLAIVFHGLTGNMEERHIRAVASAINEAGVATLRVELYGHGQSDGSFHEHTLYRWITNALAVIDHAKALGFADGLYLCGHSQGGLLTMLVAAMRQDDVRAIIPLSPAVVIVDGARRGELLGISFDPDHVPDELVAGDLALNGNYVRVAQTLDVDEAIRRFRKPVLLVHGSADRSVPVRYSIDAAEKYADARLVVLPDDDHGYSLHLDEMTEAVRAFLRCQA